MVFLALLTLGGGGGDGDGDDLSKESKDSQKHCKN